MSYQFVPGRRYRMPTHFGPAPGPRQDMEGRQYACLETPKAFRASAEFEVEATALASWLPPRFEPRAAWLRFTFTYYSEIQWLAGRGYNTFGVSAPATFHGEKESVDGDFLFVLWENMADPIITGREELGFSKVFCDLPEAEASADSLTCRASWDGHEFARLELQGLTELAPSALPPSLPSAGQLHYKFIPRTGSVAEADASYAALTPAENYHTRILKASKAASAEMRVHQSTWAQLPTLVHIVNALAEVELGTCLQATTRHLVGAKDLSDQRILQ